MTNPVNYNLLWYHDANPFEKISCSFSRIFYHSFTLSLFLSFSIFFVDTDLADCRCSIKRILLNVNQVPLSGVISILVSLIIKRGGKKAIKIDPRVLNWLSEEKFGWRRNSYLWSRKLIDHQIRLYLLESENRIENCNIMKKKLMIEIRLKRFRTTIVSLIEKSI